MSTTIIVPEGVVLTKVIATREMAESEPVKQTITVDFSGETLERLLDWSMRTIVISLQNGKLRELGEDYLKVHPEMTFKSVELLTGKKTPETPEQKALKALVNKALGAGVSAEAIQALIDSKK